MGILEIKFYRVPFKDSLEILLIYRVYSQSGAISKILSIEILL